MSCPDYLRRTFLRVDPNTTNPTAFWGAYNALLYHLFPGPDGFIVVPPHHLQASYQTFDPSTLFVMERHQRPIFFIEGEIPGRINDPLDRIITEERICKRYESLRDDLDIPFLHGVSALGTRLSFYRYTKETCQIEPIIIQQDIGLITDTSPAERWDTDLLQVEGYAKLKKIADEVKEMCKAL